MFIKQRANPIRDPCRVDGSQSPFENVMDGTTMGQRHSFCYPEGQALLPAEWAQRLTLCALSTTWKRRARIETSGTTVNVAGLAIAVLQLEAALDAPPLYDNRRAKTAACSQELQGSGLVIP